MTLQKNCPAFSLAGVRLFAFFFLVLDARILMFLLAGCGPASFNWGRAVSGAGVGVGAL